MPQTLEEFWAWQFGHQARMVGILGAPLFLCNSSVSKGGKEMIGLFRLSLQSLFWLLKDIFEGNNVF